MDWIAAYPKSKRPRNDDIEAYLESAARERFRSLMEWLASLGLRYVAPKFAKTYGWRLAIGRSGLIMIDGVCFGDNGFSVEDVPIEDDATLERVLADIEARYHGSFTARFEAFAEKRSRRQAEGRAQRKARETEAREKLLTDGVTYEQLNVFQWSPRVSRSVLQRLYDADARGLQDTELVDEVGYTFYARCVQARDAWSLMQSRRLKCHGCGKVLEPGPDPMRCVCGRVCQFREYARSFRKAQMPRGAASVVFDGFIESWPKAGSYAVKMRLIDNLIHEFHTNLLSGVPGRPVGINLIQGSLAQVRTLVEGLARA